jgi:hypothetical protein
MEHSRMTKDELTLLLVVGRILRASRSEACDYYSQEDVYALDEALAPWQPWRLHDSRPRDRDKDALVEDATNENGAA